MDAASPSSDRDLQAGLDPSAGSSSGSSSISISRDSNMAIKFQNAASLTFQLVQKITDNFLEERKIGQGACGTVYKGVHANGEEIAVKLLRNDLQGIDDDQFKCEFENLMRLDHHNIVQLVGYCYETHYKHMLYNGRTIYAEERNRALCFEYMRNGSLQKHISEECDGLDWHTRYGIIKGTCEGLKYLQEGFNEPIYHMDLKPDNILLDENMVPKLADFGLSKFYDGEQSMITQCPRGTIGYLPPEYLFQRVVSKKLDIFSLGVILTKIITGPKGPTRRAEMTHQEFIDQVHVNWRKRLQETWRASQLLEAYCKQVNICIEIALTCMENDRHKRPTIVDIIHKLNQTETVIKELKNDQGVLPEYDPLPGIDGLRINGEAFPGRELQVSWYAINGTTSCKFEWVRHLENGSVRFIEGARQPTYLVTADDVDTLLAIVVQPLDDRERKGDIVKVYANEQRKISCDPETKELIEQTLSVDRVSYEVLVRPVVLERWNPCVLAVTSEGYTIKCNRVRGVVTAKFQKCLPWWSLLRGDGCTEFKIGIPCGRPTEFSVVSANGEDYRIKPAKNSPSRDTIVLILRAFSMKDNGPFVLGMCDESDDEAFLLRTGSLLCLYGWQYVRYKEVGLE